MELSLLGWARRLNFLGEGGSERKLRLTGYDSLAVANIEPGDYELTRSGRRFYGGAQDGATGRAPVTAIPTTGAAFMLFNGEKTGGKNYAIEQISITQISGTAAVGGTILAGLTRTTVTAPSAAAGYATVCMHGQHAKSSAVWGDNLTLSAAPLVWFALKSNANAAVATIGGDSVDVGGRIIVPPGYGLVLNYFSATGTTPLHVAYAMWSELDGSLE